MVINFSDCSHSTLAFGGVSCRPSGAPKFIKFLEIYKVFKVWEYLKYSQGIEYSKKHSNYTYPLKTRYKEGLLLGSFKDKKLGLLTGSCQDKELGCLSGPCVPHKNY